MSKRCVHFNPVSGAILGWIDPDAFSYASLPSPAHCLGVSDDVWESRANFQGWIVKDGQLSAPPVLMTDYGAQVRTRRDALLAASDWVTLRAADTGKAAPAKWLKYRQALRDVTTQRGFPTSIDWPTLPDDA